jgi:anion-transporting  ArsA/GET3 family ATPase
VSPAEFLRASRVLIVAGKGGVGKTTVAAALAALAHEEGLRPLLVAVDGGGADVDLSEGSVERRLLTPDAALAEYLSGHGLGRITRRLATSGAIDVVSTAAPGIRDLLVLGKVKQLERSGHHDLVVVDAPAAGHAVPFLAAPAVLHDLVAGGPVRSQADEVLELLADPARCSVLLVTLPEEAPVNEVTETAFHLEDRVGVKLGPVVVNGVRHADPALARDPAEAAAEAGARLSPAELDALRRAADTTTRRARRDRAQLDRLRRMLPLPQLVLPRLPTPVGLVDALRTAIGSLR